MVLSVPKLGLQKKPDIQYWQRSSWLEFQACLLLSSHIIIPFFRVLLFVNSITADRTTNIFVELLEN